MNEIDLYESISSQSMPVYFLSGEEKYSIDKAIVVAKNTLKEPFRELNFTVIDSDYDSDIDTIINSCESIPFMDDKRIVVIKSSDLFQASAKNYGKEQIQKIVSYLDSPSKTTMLIFAPNQVDKRSELYKIINKKYGAYQSDKLNKVEFFTWISNRFEERHIKADKATVEHFVQKSGYLFKESQVTLLDVENEIEKLSFSSEEKTLSILDIDKTSSNIEKNDVFKFIDYIFACDAKNAYAMMKNIFYAQKSPVMILSLIARQISILMKVSILKRNRFSQEDMANILSIHPYVIKKSVAQLKRYTYSDLINLYNLCSDMDYRIKKGQIKDTIGVEVMVNRVCKVR